MCHFITATLPRTVNVARAEEVFAKHKLRFEQIDNESVREHLEPGDLYILTTQGMCDCGTVLGSEHREEEPSSDQKEFFRKQTIEKFKKKGWSDTKIDRWFNEAALTEEKERRGKELQHETSMTIVSDWLEFIEDVLDSRISPRIGLLLHSYTGRLDSKIAVMGKEQISRKELDHNVLLQMAEDIIYDFVASRR